ncbi:hypothetical protein HJG60_010486 [Phyllostomus discolor]|uniref:Uncharacterized protein n=1 Tax=Phyllostomus discolor TaxID=89673 RepID=A0A834APD4_9CHIR|nr:hypothetical protein HJG60_010486 [Phyllostomus discolor]
MNVILSVKAAITPSSPRPYLLFLYSFHVCRGVGGVGGGQAVPSIFINSPSSFCFPCCLPQHSQHLVLSYFLSLLNGALIQNDFLCYLYYFCFLGSFHYVCWAYISFSFMLLRLLSFLSVPPPPFI